MKVLNGQVRTLGAGRNHTLTPLARNARAMSDHPPQLDGSPLAEPRPRARSSGKSECTMRIHFVIRATVLTIAVAIGLTGRGNSGTVNKNIRHFVWTLIVFDSDEMPSVQTSPSRLASGYFADYSPVPPDAIIAELPVIIALPCAPDASSRSHTRPQSTGEGGV